LEEGWGGVVVSSLGLDGFDDNGAGGKRVREDETFNICESLFFDLLVFLDVIFERVLEEREGCLWPVECWNIEFVNWLGASGGKRAEKTSGCFMPSRSVP